MLHRQLVDEYYNADEDEEGNNCDEAGNIKDEDDVHIDADDDDEGNNCDEVGDKGDDDDDDII